MNTVTLRWKGPSTFRRIVEGVEWNPANGHTADAPIEMAADLLTGRESDRWELAGKPKPAVMKRLAELMGLAPVDLIVVTGDSTANETDEVNNG